MRVKLYKRSIIINNLLVFILFSIIFLHILYSLDRGISAYSVDIFRSFLSDNILLSIVAFVTGVSIWNIFSFSKILFFLFCSLIFISGMVIFFHNFDKFILVLDFIYLLLAVYFYIFWKLELEEAIYHPNFSSADINKAFAYSLNIEVELDSGEKIKGHLTNWDNNSCFLFLEMKNNFRGRVNLHIEFENRIFAQRGVIISQYGSGIGVKFSFDEDYDSIGDDGKNRFHWIDFLTIISDRGYQPGF